jgi:hypothetical protein
MWPFNRRLQLNAGVAGPPNQSTSGSTGVLSPFADDSHLGGVIIPDLIAELWGVDSDRLPMTRDLAMTVPPVARARNVLAPTAGRLPLRVYRGAVEVTARTCLTQPETVAARPRFVTILWTLDQMLFHGRAWWLVVERFADTGAPRSFEWVPEWNAKIEHGQLVATQDGRHPKIEPADVVRIDAPNEGILNYGADTIRQALRLDRAALRIADNPVPAIELHQTTPDNLEQSEVDQLIAGWIRARRQSGVGYTNAAIDARVHGLNPEQLVIEGRKFAALQVARMIGVPAWVVDASVEGSSLTYSNVPSRSRELVDYALTPYLAAIEARLSMDDVLPRGQWCKFDLDDLLRGDFADRMTAYKTAVESGVYTADELRAREDGEPAEREDTPS